MKKIVGIVSLILVAIILGTAMPVNAGATSMPLAYQWFSGTVTPPVGKVIFNMPNNHNKLLVTVILQGIQQLPNPATYSVGFDIFGACPNPFGPIAFDGSLSFCQSQYPVGIYYMGTITTDEFGDGSFHMNLNDLPTGSYNLIFWIVPCGPDPNSCGYVPREHW